MSEQDATQSSTKQRRSRKTNTINQENGKQAPATQRPANDDTEAWKVYWKTQGQPWRTEPEIDAERQKYLAERRNIIPDIEKCIYSFKDIKLTRADVEWLLATHENGRGPVDWSDEKQRKRIGLDLRRADLRYMDLSYLPLSCLLGGEYTKDEWLTIAIASSDIAGIHLEGANLIETQLESSNFTCAHLEGANLTRAHLEEADLRLARLEESFLRGVSLRGCNCIEHIWRQQDWVEFTSVVRQN